MWAWRLLPWLITYAVVMAYFESAVVVYLRIIYYPQGFPFPLAPRLPDMVVKNLQSTVVLLMGGSAT